MKRIILIGVISIALSGCAVAGGKHAHFRQLERAGCTQVEEANGQCPQLEQQHQRHHRDHQKSEAEAMDDARRWDEQHSEKPSTDYLTPAPKMCDDLPVDATNSERKNCISEGAL